MIIVCPVKKCNNLEFRGRPKDVRQRFTDHIDLAHDGNEEVWNFATVLKDAY